MEKEKKEYISIKVAPYCLPSLLLALYNQGLNWVWVTQEDDDLIVRLEKERVDKIVYHLTSSSQEVAEVSCGTPNSNNERNLLFNNQSAWLPMENYYEHNEKGELDWVLVLFKEKDTDYFLLPTVACYDKKGKKWLPKGDDENEKKYYNDACEPIAYAELPDYSYLKRQFENDTKK